jgi:hypothetical protein
MNVLSFVFTMLLIFAITFGTLFVKTVSSQNIAKSYSGYMLASRKSFNDYENQYYNFLKGKTTPRKQRGETKKESTPNMEIDEDEDYDGSDEDPEAASPKDIRRIKTENAKINLYLLIKEGKENHLDTYNLLSQLIASLYSDTKFFKEKNTKHFEFIILDELIKSLQERFKNDSKNIFFEQLNLNTFQETYYKMLKGVKFYDFDLKKGYPSLLNFITISSSNTSNKFSIYDVSKEILSLLFNKNIAKEIESYQKIKNLKITEDLILKICEKNHFPTTSLAFLDFSNKKNKKSTAFVQGIDEATSISLKREMSF